MKRTTLMAALTGAAVLLAGCSSTSGTATPASTSSSSAAATSSSAMSSMSSSMAAPSSAAAVSEAPSSDASASEPAGSASSSEVASSPESSATESAPSAESTTSSSKAPTTTVGDQSEGLDVKSAAWFTEFCGGLQPLGSIAKDAGAISGSDQTAAQKALVNLYSKIGSSFTATAAKLKPLPAPTFSGGEAFATKVVAALETSGPTFSADAKKLAAIDVKKDPSAFSKAIEGISKDLGTATGPLNDLNSLKLTPQTQASFEKLPACAKLKSAATG